MTDDQVVQFLRSVRYSDPKERHAGRLLSINRIATTAKVQNGTIYGVITGKHRPSPRLRRAVQQLVNNGA